MTENQQNLAYQLLVEKYVLNPTQEQLDLCNGLFTEWCESGNQNLLSHLLEFIDSHESKVIRNLALDTLKKTLPKETRKNIIELWINHPSPNLLPYIRSILKTTKLPQPLIAATYLMLDEWDLLEQIDPELELLDQYVKNLDPLMGSLLFARINQLKSFESYETHTTSENVLNDDPSANVSLLDKIRSKDYEYLWENILQYPFPFICELLKILSDDGWMPQNRSDLDIYENLIEQIGVRGWANIEKIKWMAVSIKEGSKFEQLSDIQIRNRQFELIIAPELINRPDRIETKNVKIRGHYNLVNPEIDLHIYQKSIRKSDIDGLLHIPIYTNNGVEIAEFMIPAVNANSFEMDEDGLYFTVRNQSGLYSLDIDALATILLPVSHHSEAVTEIIPTLKEKARKSSLSALNSLELLSSLHRGREFALWDLKQKGPLDESDQLSLPCSCIIGLDIGDHRSKVVYIPDTSCGTESKTWNVPSLIHFISLNDFIIGDEVINLKLENSSQTFKHWKSGLYAGNNSYLRIRHTKISAQKAFEYFITQVLDNVSSEISHKIPSISFSYSIEMSLSVQREIISFIEDLGYLKVILVDTLTSLSLSEFKLANNRENTLLLDIGSSQMSGLLFSSDAKKSRKRLEPERLREKELGKPTIIAKLSTRVGSIEITNLLNNLIDNKIEFSEMNEIKHKLSFDFEVPVGTSDKIDNKFSLNENSETDSINVREAFLLSDTFTAFKLLIRNIIVKATQRGVDRTKIEKIIISGEGANWPLYLDYLNENFQEKELLIEKDGTYVAVGAAIAGLGQSWEFKSERDYMLKITYEGTTHFESLIQRGENMINQFKNFEIRLKARFERIVLDCWSRIPRFVNDIKVLPVKDTDYLDHRRSDIKYFGFDRIHRDLNKVDKDTILSVNVTSSGKLLLKFSGDKMDKTIDLQTYIH
ncbi:MAG: hypothetical protein GPJ54_06455 [Candidatus Heimdallarchaeota archaeon]|nr:hypothetical protein [Candidatus Heimdallarchaeota archaeon]